MQFEFDPVKAHSNLKKHGVSFSDAEAALRDDRAATMEDPSAIGEQRFLTLGMDALGRVLLCATPSATSVRASFPLAKPVLTR
jgi:uncharacterized DUF497 family protein